MRAKSRGPIPRRSALHAGQATQGIVVAMRKLLRKRWLALSVVIAFNVMTAYALARPAVCSSRRCGRTSQTAEMPGMPLCSHCHPHRDHMPARRQHSPCSPISRCVSHAQQPFATAQAASAPQRGHIAFAAMPATQLFPVSRTSSLIRFQPPPIDGRHNGLHPLYLRI